MCHYIGSIHFPSPTDITPGQWGIQLQGRGWQACLHYLSLAYGHSCLQSDIREVHLFSLEGGSLTLRGTELLASDYEKLLKFSKLTLSCL